MQGVHELRYEVYCEERGFLPSQHYPDRREVDAFDASSVHFCELDAAKNLAGYARLVRSNEQDMFPFQEHCKTLLSDVVLPPSRNAAEVSRLILRGDQRRQRKLPLPSDICVPQPLSVPACRTIKPLTLPKLYRQMVVHSLATNIQYWYAAMERPLARSLVHMNYPFRQITPQIDYYGPVATYLLDMDELQDRLSVRNPEHLAWLTDLSAEAIVGTMPPLVASRSINLTVPHSPATLSPPSRLPLFRASGQAMAFDSST